MAQNETEVLNVMTIVAILCTMFQVDLLFQVTMWYFAIKSQSLCFYVLYRSGSKLTRSFSNQAFEFAPPPPILKRKLEPNLGTTLWATSSTSSCNLPVCS